MLQLSDTIEKTLFYNAQNGYIVAKTAKGSIITGNHIGSDDGNLDGIAIVATGVWQQHKSYGMQFVATQIEIAEEPLFYFLSKVVKGIGPKLARQIISNFGAKKIEYILNNCPEEIKLIKGIKGKKAKKIIDSWKQYKHIKEATEYLVPLGVTSSMVVRVFNHFQELIETGRFNLVERLKANIYIITKVPGIGFKTADNVALSTGINPFCNERLEACIEYIVFKYTNDEGNSCMDTELLVEKVEEETAIESEEGTKRVETEFIYRSISTMASTEKLSILDDHTVTLPFLKYCEEQIYSIMLSKSKSIGIPLVSNIDKYISSKEQEVGFLFAPKQKEAIIEISKGRKAFLLSGYAGTGKSTIAKAVLDLYRGIVGYDEIMCCALSGIASDKIRKTSGYQAATIQSLLAKAYMGEGNNGTLPYSVVLIDESSMVNSDIMYKLLKTLSKETVVIMAGDPAQFPPIGAGNPFSDLIESKQIEGVELTDIYRQSEDSVITYFANQIREAKTPDNFLADTYEDWDFKDISISGYWDLKRKVEAKEATKAELDDSRNINNEKIAKHIQSIFREKARDFAVYLKNKEIDKYLSCLQIVTPMKNGTLGTNNLNNLIQSTINNRLNEQQVLKCGTFNINLFDKIIHLVNKMMDCCSVAEFKSGNSMSKTKVYNGMLGVVFKIDHEEELLHVYFPADDMVVEYGFQEARDMLGLAYALTGHKTQGSQFHTVVIPITYSHYIMSNVKMLYTTITRAEKKVILVGESSAFKTGCTRKAVTVRDTVIKRKVQKLGLCA